MCGPCLSINQSINRRMNSNPLLSLSCPFYSIALVGSGLLSLSCQSYSACNMAVTPTANNKMSMQTRVCLYASVIFFFLSFVDVDAALSIPSPPPPVDLIPMCRLFVCLRTCMSFFLSLFFFSTGTGSHSTVEHIRKSFHTYTRTQILFFFPSIPPLVLPRCGRPLLSCIAWSCCCRGKKLFCFLTFLRSSTRWVNLPPLLLYSSFFFLSASHPPILPSFATTTLSPYTLLGPALLYVSLFIGKIHAIPWLQEKQFPIS